MELKITKEKVLEAASKCSTAEQTLKTLFPEIFEDEIWIKFEKVLQSYINAAGSDKLYAKLPGYLSDDKAKWIIDLIRKNIVDGK